MMIRSETRHAILGATGLGIALAVGAGGCGSGRPEDTASTNSTDGTVEVPQTAKAAQRPTTPARKLDAEQLPELKARLTPDPEVPAVALDQATADEWLEVLDGMRSSFPHYGIKARAQALELTPKILERFTVEPAPASWSKALPLAAELFAAGLNDGAPVARIAALEAVAQCWSWLPGAAMARDQERAVSDWKEHRLHAPTLRTLDDKEPAVRLAAVKCLAALPIDSAAAPATRLLRDENPAVRLQVLNSFAPRPDVLDNEDLLPRLYDPEPSVALTAEVVLQTRGLDKSLIGLAKLLYHPKPEMRVSALPFLLERTDIDPFVWLLRLSHDLDESVRGQVLEALAELETEDARRRIAEMALNDPSDQVRASAKSYLPETPDLSNLPPLPGTPSLLPKAN